LCSNSNGGAEKIPNFIFSATVRITVIDQNDNPPLFEKNEYALQVMESESIGYTLVTVQAQGGDAGETVTYSLAENGTHNSFVELDKEKGCQYNLHVVVFTVKPCIAGILKLAKGLDFEKEKLLSVTVVATDSGKPPLSSEAVVTIQVLDENDNIPVFTKESYKASVDENSAKGTKVLKVKAVDADSEHYGRVAYAIKEDPGPFQIDDNGWIAVAGVVDRETKPYHRF
ncbi:cadherin domain protein, partial [Ancylostoma caninum]